MGAIMRHRKIFLVFSDTGAGHRTAAEAIKRCILELSEKRAYDPPAEIVMQDVVEDSNAINRMFAHMYNRLLKDHQDWMKYYISLIEWIKPNESDVGYQMFSAYSKKLITEMDPSIIVSVHPMVNHYLARTLNDLGLHEKIKLITVLTDPNANLWSGWACPDADLTIAPNDLAFNRLVAMGLDPSKIKVMGMPILPEFLKPPTESRQELLTRLGLDPSMVTVTITSGSAGGGNMFAIYKALEKVKKKIQVIFVCGKNEHLKEQMEKEAANSPLKTVVLLYAKAVSDGMNATDLLVTKAGGLTTFEAIARRLPMALDMVTEPMPQEAGTAEMLIEAGLASGIKHPEDIIPVVETLEVINDRLAKPLPKAHNLDHVDAVYEIASTILDYLEPVTEQV
jgi:UDP-N-acetylglucosamine:LPS N-acetylglucosamine transferase